MNREQLAARIDHTLLGATATRDGVRKLCNEAVRYGTASVCVNPCHVALARECVSPESPVKICAVIGFPHGMTTPEVKAYETTQAIADGAEEVDMVLPVGAVKDRDYAAVSADISAVVAAARKAPHPVVVKVILETCFLEDEEKVAAAELVKKAGADFVKTSTGFGTSGATAEDVALLRRTVGPEMGVKAAGGIRDTATALAMLEAGASRIGASRTVDILNGLDA
jgi:deoxyribose-phosphate aldolase